MFKYPILITNFKNYSNGIGKKAVDLALCHEKLSHEYGVSVAVVVNPFDVYRVSQAVRIPVLTAHLDPVDFGPYTGALLPQAAKAAGACGTVLNHAEKPLENEVLEQAICLVQKSNLLRLVCADSVEQIEEIFSFDISLIAFEPPELIGSSEKSVSNTMPESITKCVQVAQKIPLLVGAGVRSADDVSVALDLGAEGVFVSSAIVKSDNPEKKIREFLEVMQTKK